MRYFLFFLLLVLFATCAQDEEACLDANAVNFDISGDIACASCCTYPVLSFNLSHLITQSGETANMQLDSFYVNDLGQDYAINDMKFLISNVELLKADGTLVEVLDTVQLNVCNGGQTSIEVLKDDFTILKRNAFSFSVGSINTSGEFIGFRFDIGLAENANNVLAENASTSHPLGINSDSLYLSKEEGYLFQKIILAKDKDAPEELTNYSISGDENKITLNFTAAFSLEKGLNTRIDLDVNYDSFFNNVDFDLDDKATIQQKILQNTPSAILLSN